MSRKTTLYEQKDDAAAERAADGIIESLPQQDESVARAYTLKGLIAERRGDTEGAEVFYHRAGSLGVARINLGVLRYRQGRLEEAEAEYREALRLDPKLAEAHIGLGNVFLDLAGSAATPAQRVQWLRDACTAFVQGGSLALSDPDYPTRIRQVDGLLRGEGRCPPDDPQRRRPREAAPPVPGPPNPAQ